MRRRSISFFCSAVNSISFIGVFFAYLGDPSGGLALPHRLILPVGFPSATVYWDSLSGGQKQQLNDLLNSKQGNAQGLTSWQIDVVLAKALQWDAAQKKALPAKPADMNGDALWLIWSMFGGWMVQEWAADKVDTNPYSIGKSGPIEEWVPIWGSGRDAINDLRNGRYGSAFVNSVFTLADVFGGAGKGAKALLKGGMKVGLKAVGKTAAKQGAQAVLRNGVLHVVRQGTLNGLRKLGQVEVRKVVGATVRKALQEAGRLATATKKGAKAAVQGLKGLFVEPFCFTPNTLVVTAQGLKPIGQVQPGRWCGRTISPAGAGCWRRCSSGTTTCTAARW